MRLFSTLFFLFCFSVLPFFDAGAEENAPIPVTVGDVENFKTKNMKERLSFIADYYSQNKERGATDEQILNEVAKLLDLTEEQARRLKDTAFLEERYQYVKSVIKGILDEANMTILEKNPGRTDMIIDLDKPDTWKNVKNIYIGKAKIKDYYEMLQGNLNFSETVSSENADAVLASCTDLGKENIAMSFILFLRNDYFIALQEEGMPANGIRIDFSGSENLEFGPVLFPMEKIFHVDEKKVAGYGEKVYLPFLTKLKDPQKNGTVRARINVDMCQNGSCQKEEFPEIVYHTYKARMESTFCRAVVQALEASPKRDNSRVKLKKAFLKKETTGDVALVAFFKLPFFPPSEVTYLIKNEQGLRFSSPLLFRSGRDMVIRSQILNPERLKEKATVTFETGYSNVASEFKTDVSIETDAFSNGISFLSFSLFDFIGAFLLGLKFFLLTPVLFAFLLLIHQTLVIPVRTTEKTYEFAEGLYKAFLPAGIAFIVFFGVNGIFRFVDVPWGRQFNSPLSDFIFAGLFVLTAAAWNKIFDDETVERLTRRFTPFFDFFGLYSSRGKAGMIAGLAVCGLLTVTPMTSLYYQVATVLERSVVLYFATFVAGALFPFLLIVLFCERAEDSEDSPEAVKIMKIFIPLPLCVQVLILLLSIGFAAGLKIFLGVSALVSLCILPLLTKSAAVKKAALSAVLAGMFFIPFYPSENAPAAFGSDPFDEEALHRQIAEGKTVYLNVSEDFCWSCLWNRFLVARGRTSESYKTKELTIMRIAYDDPFLKKILSLPVFRTLPMNIFFSPVYPEGKIVTPYFDVWSAQKETKEAMPPKEIEPLQRIEPEQKTPDPAAKGTD